MSQVKVPSDITILEHKYSRHNAKRKIHFLKRFFIHCSFFTLGTNCNKLNSNDVLFILSNVYSDNEKNTSSENSLNILNILNTRQKDVEKQVQCKACSLLGSILFTLHGYKHFKYYDLKSKLIILPFFSIAGIYLGSFFGNLATGRLSDYKRSKFLGTLPANVFLKN